MTYEFERDLSSFVPTLFLSFGGVLHIGHGLVDDEGIVTLDSGHTPLEFAFFLEDIIAPWPQVQIILTTTLLRTLGAEKTIALLPDELRQRVVDTTRSRMVENIKSKTLSTIVYSTERRLTNWLAVDDGAWTVPRYAEHYLCTDSEAALDDSIMRRRLRIWLEHACE
ncbi:hypothetical protein LJ655_08925 [Paraburkholderia sp. MMS20-SJTN17]|uniref:Uncharacterized protein n=1 Tax=Paraburkholderia translucens TaxID=2886945 RepID=A0ABS8KC16_9BURK|nr:HAD domain-containing protein [Paraburkholderia sp. MMS20-SJTN17]MCC8402014.1 hypothetical protein [Paraburkholderia sp. MMS20-SJTN17]